MKLYREESWRRNTWDKRSFRRNARVWNCTENIYKRTTLFGTQDSLWHDEFCLLWVETMKVKHLGLRSGRAFWMSCGSQSSSSSSNSIKSFSLDIFTAKTLIYWSTLMCELLLRLDETKLTYQCSIILGLTETESFQFLLWNHGSVTFITHFFKVLFVLACSSGSMWHIFKSRDCKTKLIRISKRNNTVITVILISISRIRKVGSFVQGCVQGQCCAECFLTGQS